VASHHLELLGLDPEQVTARADFLLAYARTARREAQESRAGAAAARDGDEDWVIRADAASALAEAAQWTMVLDAAGARRLLTRAGRAFVDLGEGFEGYGLFLLATGGEPLGQHLGLIARDLDLLGGRGAGDRSAVDPVARTGPEPMPWALSHVQQQAYLLLACAGSAEVVQRHGEQLRRLVTDSPNRLAVLPAGAVGTPVGSYWTVARLLLGGRAEADLGAAVPILAAAAGRYAEAVRAARANDYTFRHAAAPVDVGDVDLAGLVALATRRFGPGYTGQVLGAELARMDPVARIPLELGMELGDPRRRQG